VWTFAPDRSPEGPDTFTVDRRIEEAAMSSTETTRRPSVGARRTGYAIGAVINALFLYLINGWPGWQSLPFLTDETPRVLALVNASLVISVAVNLAYLAYDAPWFTAAGGTLTVGVGLAVLIRIWQVFPFAFGGTFDWARLIRVVLVVGIIGSLIGLVVQAVQTVVRIARAGAGVGSGQLRH
jgi:hypothetical protein